MFFLLRWFRINGRIRMEEERQARRVQNAAKDRKERNKKKKSCGQRSNDIPMTQYHA